MQLNKQTLTERFDLVAVTAIRYAFNSSAIGGTTYDRRGNLTTVEVICAADQTDFVVLENDEGSFVITAEELFA